ncbi:MAG: Gfo/Idh/MocA family oxidoreductase [Bacillota bacterium]|nr:Gfo/Idh/MocA family oxidoreductase [Bacillota bacterium]
MTLAKENQKVRVGIIGIGNMGTGHIGNWLKGLMPEVDVTAVADRDAKRREWAAALAAEHKIDWEIFTEGSDLIASDCCDAILIAVPHYQHPELAVAGFANNKHVMVEKPAGVYTQQVREMNEAARNYDLVFAMMFNQRTNPLYIRMRELITSGELGEIRRVNWIITDWYRSQAYYDSGSWRATWAGEGGGVLINQCPHQLDLLQWICGLPVRVSAHAHEGKWHDIEVEDDVTAYLEFANGATGVFVTTTGDIPGTNRFEVTLDGGRLIAENDVLTLDRLEVGISQWTRETTQGFGRPGVTREVIDTSGVNPQHVGIMNSFTAAILRGEKLLAAGEEGINGLMLSNAIHLSSWLGRPVDLPVDEALFLEELNKRRATSRLKEDVESVTFDTSGTY